MYNKLLKTTLRLTLVSAIFAASVLPQTVTAEKAVYYVKEKAAGKGNGTSWENASGDLQAMIDDASSGDEVWVYEGTYIPTKKAGDGTDDRDCAFVLKTGVNIYGGFTSADTEGVPDFGTEGRNGTSTLSGDLGTPDDNSDNAYHVVIGARITIVEEIRTVLDGFTISGGNANGGNSIRVNGLAISRNSGGGIYNSTSFPELTNLIISGNTASNNGGGISNNLSTPILENVTISGNVASNGGGGIYNSTSIPKLSGVIISGNKANNGGGIFNSLGSSPELSGVTISGNNATNGSGIYSASYSYPKLTSTIVWGNGDGDAQISGGTVTYESSLVQGLDLTSVGKDNLDGTDLDPMFVSPISADKAPTTDGDYDLWHDSPLIKDESSIGAYKEYKASYGISLSPTTYTFTPATFGDKEQSLSVTVKNTGNAITGELTVKPGGTNAASFDITENNATDGISENGGTKTFNVVSKAGLNAGTYTAIITVSNENVGSESLDISFTVNKATPTTDDLDYDLTAVDYTGKERPLTVTESSTGIGGITVMYDGSTTVPTNAGTYDITVDIDGEGENFNAATLSLGKYGIGKIKPTIKNLAYKQKAEVDYNGEPRPLAVTPAEGITGLGAITVMYNGSTTAPTNAGTYDVTVDIATGDNYTNNRQSVMSLGKYTINKIDPKPENIACDLHSVVGNGSPQSVTVKGIDGLGAIKVLYQGSNEENATENKPINPGVYTVSVTIAANTNYYAAGPWELGEFTIYKPQTIQHSVTILSSPGLKTYPSAGSHSINAGANFTFRITLDAPSSTGALPQVQTDRTGTRTDGPADFLITPDADGLNYTVVIFAVNQDIVISLDAPTGNAAVADALTLGTVPGALVVTNSRSDAVTLQVYTPAGTPVRLTTIPPGTTRLTVPPGIYIVSDGGAFRRKTAVVQ